MARRSTAIRDDARSPVQWRRDPAPSFRVVLGLMLLFLTARQRPTSCNRGNGCGNGCSANLAPRTIALTPAPNADRYTFHFLVGTSTAITGSVAIPSEFYQGAAQATALTTLDSNSDAYILDGDSNIAHGGLRGPTF